jgi:O-antigen ligase
VILGTLTLLAAIQYINAVGATRGFIIGEVQGMERGEPRYFGPVGDSIGMVLLLGYLAALCAGRLIGALFFLGGIMLTAGLGALIATAVGTVFFVFVGLRRPEIRAHIWRRSFLVPLLTVLGLAALIAFPNSLGTTLTDRVMSGTYLQSGAQRQASGKLAGAMILDNPILGVGYMGYERALGQYGGDAYFNLQSSDGGTANANNQVLQVLTDSGIPGLLAFAGLVFCAARLFHRVTATSGDRFVSAFYLAALLWLLTQLFGNLAAVWLNPASFITRLLWVLLGVAVGINRLLPLVASASRPSRSSRSEPQLLPA